MRKVVGFGRSPDITNVGSAHNTSVSTVANMSRCYHRASGYAARLVRPAFFVIMVGLLLAPPARAEDARVSFLVRQLRSTQDPRVKAQTVLLLSQTASPDAVKPLCESLKDSELVVRTAAANAIAELKQPSAVQCLKDALSETDSGLRAALQKALDSLQTKGVAAAGVAKPGSLYLHVEPIVDKVGMADAATLADSLLRQTLAELGASFAPEGEDRKAAQMLIKSKKLKGFQLRLQLLPGSSEKGLKVEMLIMTYPEQALQGSWNVKASGGKPEALIKAMVPRVVEDAAGDLNWKNEGAP